MALKQKWRVILFASPFLVLLAVGLGFGIRYRWYSPRGVIVSTDTRMLEQHYQKADITGDYLPPLSVVGEMERRLAIHMSKMYCQGQRYKFTDYRYQYVGLIHKGQRKIYVMSRPHDTEHWKWWWGWQTQIIIRTFDGGPKIFNVEYDVASGKFPRTWFNGPLMIDGGECGVTESKNRQ